MIDPQGKIVSLNIKAYGHVAAFFEQESVQRELREAVRRNNLEFAGYDQENVDIKKKVEAKVPVPPNHSLCLLHTSFSLTCPP